MTEQYTENRPLEGLSVLDLSTVVMGPYTSLLLADMGADVVKLEAPQGDQVRYYKPQRDEEMSGMFLTLHRNKRSIVLDLKSAKGQTAFKRLASKFDVILHNFRQDVASRLGVTYKELQTHNPQLILCKVYGFGANGPYGSEPAYDDVIQAASGLAGLYGDVHGEPKYVPSMICDKIVGQMAALAILAACYKKEKQNKGSEIEVPMFETMVSFNLVENLAEAAFIPPMGKPGWARNVSPMRKPFKTANGYMCLLPYSDQNWEDFFDYIGKPKLIEDSRFSTLPQRAQNIDELYKYVEKAALERTNEEWISFCKAHSIPCSPVNKLNDLFNDAHLKAVSMFEMKEHTTQGKYRSCRNPVIFNGKALGTKIHAPSLGEHTESVLTEIGFDEEEIAELVKKD